MPNLRIKNIKLLGKWIQDNANFWSDGSYDGFPTSAPSEIKWAFIDKRASAIYLYTKVHPAKTPHLTVIDNSNIHYTNEDTKSYDSDDWPELAKWIIENFGGFNPDASGGGESKILNNEYYKKKYIKYKLKYLHLLNLQINNL